MHTEGSQEPSYAEIYKEIAAPWGRATPVLREPAQSTHGHVTRAILCRNLQVKGRRPRASKTRGADFARACAIVWTWNKDEQGPFCRNSKGKSRAPERAPRSSTGLNPYCKNPSVRIRCLGKTIKLRGVAII